MRVRRVLICGFVSLGLSFAPSFSQARSLYWQNSIMNLAATCSMGRCSRISLVRLLQNIGILKRTNKFVVTADDLIRAAQYSGMLWAVTALSDHFGLAKYVLSAKNIKRLRGMGPAALVLGSSAVVFAVIGLGVNLLTRTSSHRTASAWEPADYYRSSPEAFQAFLNLTEDRQFKIASEAALSGHPELAQLIDHVAQGVQQAE